MLHCYTYIRKYLFLSILLILPSNIYLNAANSENIIVKAYALAASCTNSEPNDDAYLQISDIIGGDKYGYSTGPTYTGPGYASATDTTVFPIIIQNNIDNPTVPMDYIVRVYNGNDTCYIDTLITLQVQDCVVECACTEMIYLNDFSQNSVHKFSIDSNGELTEIGSPWLASESINAPHGLGIDLNGFLYIGEVVGYNQSLIGNVFQIDCNGNVLDNDYINLVNDNFGFQLMSKNGILYTNNSEDDEIQAFDLCTGDLIGSMQVDGNTNVLSWGMHIDESNNTWYFPDRYTGKMYSGSLDIALYTTPATNSGIEVFDMGVSALSSFNFAAVGMTKDADGNYFVIFNAIQGTFATVEIRKYDSNGTLLTTISDNNSTTNVIDGQSGFWGARGIIYSENTNLIYVGNFENCISVFDTDLMEMTALNINNAEGSSAKGVSIIKECCPIPNNQIIDQVYCVSGSNEELFLNELFPCAGTICEGMWQTSNPAAEAIYNDCDQSIIANAPPGCYSFIKESDGTGINAQCGAFNLEFNLEILETPQITVSADTTICEGATATLTVTTTASILQWQMSTISCTNGFTDIIGATSSTYETEILNDITYYRVVVSKMADCSSGNCDFESECVTVNVDPTCSACEETNCLDIQVIINE